MPEMTVIIASRSDVCLSSCSSISEYTESWNFRLLKGKIILSLFVRMTLPHVLELWASEVWHYLEIYLSLTKYSTYMQGSIEPVSKVCIAHEATMPAASKDAILTLYKLW